jgi:hypothetical protein
MLEIRLAATGQEEVVLKNGQKVEVSWRRFRDLFQALAFPSDGRRSSFRMELSFLYMLVESAPAKENIPLRVVEGNPT